MAHTFSAHSSQTTPKTQALCFCLLQDLLPGPVQKSGQIGAFQAATGAITHRHLQLCAHGAQDILLIVPRVLLGAHPEG